MTHRFRTGQTVQLANCAWHVNAARGIYKVTRQLPADDGECRYRIKSTGEQYERVVKESDLEGV